MKSNRTIRDVSFAVAVLISHTAAAAVVEYNLGYYSPAEGQWIEDLTNTGVPMTYSYGTCVGLASSIKKAGSEAACSRASDSAGNPVGDWTCRGFNGADQLTGYNLNMGGAMNFLNVVDLFTSNPSQYGICVNTNNGSKLVTPPSYAGP